ncbi:NAD-dependent epimerase/dehydratase family protein [Egicoccus sp. AB-alg2]|uniref:NAD-dependent epimerase/dehydratase family protein n=1 Tax=Egicoccus sp. AB-alg2 TaxID=3242693 RepID=UPI00359D5066
MQQTSGMPRRVLVTGAAGFIGSHLAEALVARGDEVVGVDAFVPTYARERKLANLAGLLDEPRFRFVELDLRTGDLDALLEGIDVVVNEAAMAGLPTSWMDAPSYVECNLIGLARLVKAAMRVGVSRFVQASTSSVYGVEACGDETMPTRPVSPYGVSKLAAEHLVLAYTANYDFPASILRYFSIYGPRQRPDMAYHRFVERLRRGVPLEMYGDGRQSRSNTYVDDCVRGTLAAIDGAEVGEVYNIGGGVSLELREAIDLLGRELAVAPRIVELPARPGDQRRTFADTSKAAETFGYTATVTPEVGLAAQVRWHLADLPGPRPPVRERLAQQAS